MAKVEVIGVPILNRTFARLGKAATGAAARRVVGAGARVIQDAARANVRARLNRNSKGRLEADITTEFENDHEATVGPRTVVYAKIHEYGGVIRPKRAAALFIPLRKGAKPGDEGLEYGRDFVLRKSVTIPARPYMRPAYDSKRRAAQEAMRKQVEAEIANAVKG